MRVSSQRNHEIMIVIIEEQGVYVVHLNINKNVFLMSNNIILYYSIFNLMNKSSILIPFILLITNFNLKYTIII